jgi:hypothetical protein
VNEYDPLAVLGARLVARGLAVDYTAEGLRVENTAVPGCCAEVPHPCAVITCRRRTDDGGMWWFYADSWGEPIAPAEQVDDAAMHVMGYLNRRPERARPEVR